MNKRYLHIGAAIAVAAVLSACGGDDHNDSGNNQTTSNNGVPSSAQQSVAGLIAYLNELISRTDETSEPVVLGDAVLPTSDTTEPTALN